MDQATSQWRQAGKVNLWRYVDEPKNYRGWHFAADAAGCDSLLELISLMDAATYTAKQTVMLTRPSIVQTQVPGYAGRHQSYGRWHVHHSKTKFALRHWRLIASGDEVTLELGTAHLDKLRQGFEDVRRGSGDYCIGEEGMDLWFWWLFA